MKRYVRLARPFTLLPPLLGIVSGAICAFGSAHNPDPARRVTWAVILTVAIGSLCASLMNAASNIVNQIADLEIDRRNKPDRPLVTGEIAIRRAWATAAVLYVLCIVPTWLVVPYPYQSLHARITAPLTLHGIAPGVTPAHLWRAALEAGAELSAATLARSDAVGGPRRRIVATGGGARGVAARAVKEQRLGAILPGQPP